MAGFEKMRSLVVQERHEKLGGNHTEGTTDGKMGTKDEVRKVQIQEAENQIRWQQRPQTGSDGSDKKMRKGRTTCTKKSTKCVAGVRKVWGTRKKESCDEIAKEIVRAVGKMVSRFSVVKRVG